MQRWLLVVAALVLAALAGMVLLRSGEPVPPATDEIDDASREALERVIREETGS